MSICYLGSPRHDADWLIINQLNLLKLHPQRKEAGLKAPELSDPCECHLLSVCSRATDSSGASAREHIMVQSELLERQLRFLHGFQDIVLKVANQRKVYTLTS